MNDADLLRLVQEKLPSDFTPAELEALRARWNESPEIRAALIDVLELETELATGLADVSLSIDDLMARAAARQSASRNSSPRWWIAIGLSAVAMLAVGIAAWQSIGKPREMGEAVAARAPANNDPTPTAETTPAAEPKPAVVPEKTVSAEATLAATMPGDVPKPAEPPAQPISEGPWTPWLNGELAPLPVDDPRLRADLRTMGHDEIPLTEFQRWWSEVPGTAAGWNEAIIGGRRTVQIDGRMQLKGPWIDDAVLRLTPFDLNDLTLLFGDQEQGVALRFYRHRDPHVWAAYEFRRLPGESTIRWGGLLSTDGGAWHRSGAATFEVRRQDGNLILSAGKVPLLTVPLSQPPQVVQLLGRGRLRGFSWLRAEPWPIIAMEPHPTVLDSSAATAWESVKPETAMVHVEPGGAVSLTGSSKTEEAQAFVKLPQSTLVESIIRLSAADAGTGIYLGNDAGKPIALLGIFQDNRSKQLAFGPLRPGERRIDADYDPNAFPPPYWSPNVWLRIVAGLGMCHVWSSGDGVHWGHLAENPMPDVNGAVRTFGLYSFPGETPRTIRIDSYQVRELTGITHFGGDPAVAQAVTLPESLPPNYSEWEPSIIEQLPEGIPPTRWMVHAAVSTLKAGPSRSLAREIVERLAESEQFQKADSVAQRTFLDDAASLLDGGHEPTLMLLRQGYFTKARTSPAAAEVAWTHWLQSPVWTPHVSTRLQSEIMAMQLVSGAFTANRDAVVDRAADAQFWLALGHPDHRLRPEEETVDRLARWARSITGASDRQADSADVLPLGWRHPWQLTVNKEAYNVRSELRSALVGGNFQDAGRIAMSFGSGDGVGLLPDMDDDRLFISIPVAMATAVSDYPAFGDALRNDLEPTGLVRVARAAHRGDLATLKSATIQFYGTAAAAEAERILGDRLMALGDFFGARRRYLDAQRSANDEQREQLTIRARLAEHLLGSPVTSPDAAALANMKLDGIALASILQETTSAAPTPSAEPAVAIPRHSRYRLDVKAQFDGQVGQNAGRNEFRQVDAFGRQFAVAVDPQRIYVSNRFQVTAYQRESGQQQWAASVGSDQGEAHAHRFTPMTPQRFEDKLIVRRLTKAGIELACLKPDDGQVLWKTRCSDKADVLSDPVILPGRIGVIVGHRSDDESVDIRWTHLSLLNGDVLAEFPLVRLRDAWSGEVPCSLSVQNDRAVAVVGGVVIGFESTGTLHWARRETWLPPKIDPQSDDYIFSTPVFATDADTKPMVIVTSPSSREVLGLDFASGRIRWASQRPTIHGMLASTASAVVFAETEGLTALSVATGEVMWSHRLSGRLTGHCVDGGQLVVTIRRESTNNKSWPQLAWFDISTGAARGEAQIELEDQSDWQVGPFFTVGNKWWTLFGRSTGKPQRELALLVATSDNTPQPWSDPDWDVWVSATPGERRLVQSILPGWQPLVAAKNVFATPLEPIRDRRPVLVAKLGKANDQVRLLRTAKIPTEGMPTLQLRVGHQPGQRWQLEVRIDGRTVLSEPVTDESAPSGWLEPRVPLFPFAGKTVTIQLIEKNLDAKSAEGLWHEARLTGFSAP